MRIIALRITGPRTRENIPRGASRFPIHPGLYVMDEEDLADAILSALEVVQIGTSRFDAILIAADEQRGRPQPDKGEDDPRLGAEGSATPRGLSSARRSATEPFPPGGRSGSSIGGCRASSRA